MGTERSHLLVKLLVLDPEKILIVLDLKQLGFGGFDQGGLVGDDVFQAVDELPDLLCLSRPLLCPALADSVDWACCGDWLVSLVRLSSRAREDQRINVLRRGKSCRSLRARGRVFGRPHRWVRHRSVVSSRLVRTSTSPQE